ncbi:MAG: class I SAM-dependent methyltransferase [Campylobacter sp.]|nr:class I SAM-dependent methyltransferase [Campylobacter sp.]
MKEKNLWDEKAKNYDKFSGNLSEFQIKFFEILSKFGVDFKDKTLIDIGCGTGIYSLHLAKICKFVLGVDSSKEMLKELENSAKMQNITNIKTIFSDFKNFKSKDKFDIAFLTMSPALQSQNDFIKFANLANFRIFMNWEKPRNSTLLTPFFEKFGVKNREKKLNSTANLLNFLKEKNIPFQSEILNEIRHSKRDFDDAFDNILWHLKINNFPYNEDEIKKMLELRFKNDFIEDEVEICVRIILF